MKKCKCMYCLEEFEAERKRHICPTCKNITASNYGNGKDSPASGQEALIESVRIIDAYNRAHGTRYSYGKFPHQDLFLR